MPPQADAKRVVRQRKRGRRAWTSKRKYASRRRPFGAPPETRQIRVTKRAPSSAGQATPPQSTVALGPARCSCLGRLPRLVARGYPVAVSGPSVLTHFYDGSSARGRPVRDRFVIFIEPAVHMSDRP